MSHLSSSTGSRSSPSVTLSVSHCRRSGRRHGGGTPPTRQTEHVTLPAIAVRRRSRRVAAAWLLTLVGLPIAVWLATRFRGGLDVSTVLLVALSLVLVIAVLGGRLVGAVAAVLASQLVNWYFVLPLHTL